MTVNLSFDDVLIMPRFSEVNSRKDVLISNSIFGTHLDIPVISSNMDTITGAKMADAMSENGAIGALHRFMSIEENVAEYAKTNGHNIVSVGIGDIELDRAKALYEAGANVFLLDVAHGASKLVVEQTKRIREIIGFSSSLIVGNFATARSIRDFQSHLRHKHDVDGYKVGIGGGSMCTTRIVTGCGMPTLASIQDCAQEDVTIIADGGLKNSGDIAKALVAGADCVMLGRMLAGTDETPGEVIYRNTTPTMDLGNGIGVSYDVIISEPAFKKYRGSASLDSYKVQGKVAQHRSPEGEATLVPYAGSIKPILQQIEGGLRSALSYVGAFDLGEFRSKADLIQITQSSFAESKPHGKL